MPNNLTTLQELAERLEKATGPIRELDVAICNALKFYNFRNHGHNEGHAYPHLTASIDASLALAVRHNLSPEEILNEAMRDLSANGHRDWLAELPLAVCRRVVSILISKESPHG